MAFFDHNIELKDDKPSNIIKVIGVGGGGSNAVRHMYDMKIQDVDFIVCNTDLQALNDNSVPTKLQLGAILTEGLGAGTEPEQGKLAAEESAAQITALLEGNTKMVFITAGMGGGTGTGAAPVIAKIAKSLDILTVAIVTAPYSWEGTEKIDAAMRGIEELQRTCDTVLVVLNDKLLEIYEDLNILEAFEHADDVLANAAKSVAEVITKSGKINADFKDVKKVLSNAGQAVMSTASSKGQNRAAEVIKSALDSPLLNNKDIKGAKRILVTVATSKAKVMGVKEQQIITDYIMKEIGDAPAGFKLGFIIDDDLGEEMRVTVIAAGFDLPEDAPLPINLNNIKEEEKKTVVKAKTEKKEGEKVITPTHVVSKQPVVVYEEEEEEEELVVEDKPEAKPIMQFNFKHEDDSLRIRKMIDAFCQKTPAEADLETPAYLRYKVQLLDISQVPEVELFDQPLYG
ncbi:cell division protein FtsZ [Flectobacillus major]|jgi:cell division protein FtsZ|uniref:cell division protein FtsZ n=1 Tax=Flectobacillus major TaxID=103 RepID=UPI00041C9A82|nr:cell division protein FtsZ [Flectobacillus major]